MSIGEGWGALGRPGWPGVCVRAAAAGAAAAAGRGWILREGCGIVWLWKAVLGCQLGIYKEYGLAEALSRVEGLLLKRAGYTAGVGS